MGKFAVIIPASNEEGAIRDVVTQIQAVADYNSYQFEVIVINDCSTDNTPEVLAGLNCTVLNLPINLGIGGAVQCGYKYAYSKGFDTVIRIDGDGQHPPEEIPKLIKALEGLKLDVVIGSRFLLGEGFQSTLIRRIGIKYFKSLNKLFTGNSISDCTSGFSLINRTALEIVCDYYPDEYPEPETIVLFSKHKLEVAEVPVIMKERQGGISSINTLSAIYYLVKVSLAILFSSIRSINSSDKKTSEID